MTPSRTRSLRRVRRRKATAKRILLKDTQVPVWWPEYTRLYLARREARDAYRLACRRFELGTWLAVKTGGASCAWMAKRIGTSPQYVDARVQAGERYAEAHRMTSESVAEMLFTSPQAPAGHTR